MAKYRKRPVVVEAEQWDGTAAEATRLGLHDYALVSMPRGSPCPIARIETLEGWLRVRKGDWIITGVKGERYACRPDIFEATYELAEGPGTS